MEITRNYEKPLLAWKNSPNRKPLVLQGVRQVGKTHLLNWFGKTHFSEIAYFNFEAELSLHQLFEATKNPDELIKNLSLVLGKPIFPQKTLVIFDEIQECRHALNSLKYFAERRPDFAICAAGSLLGVTLGQEASFPVGKVDFLTVYPLTFSEFLQATNPRLLDFVQQIETLAPVPDVFLTPLTSLLRQYFVSGGMPESVAAIVGEADAGKSLASRKAILQAYELDFAKHAPARNVIKMLHLWKSIPAQLGRENKKFLYQLARPGARARDYEEALQWLIQAGLFQRVFHCRQPNIPLAAYDDLNIFKIYLHDTGLLATHAGLDAATLLAGNRLFTEFKGALTENYVLQSLQTQLENQPRYWTSDGQAEIDLLIEYRGRVIPVEIKAEENTKSKSLLVYRQRFQPEVAIRFSMKNLSFENGLLTIPLPLADLTTRFLDLVL